MSEQLPVLQETGAQNDWPDASYQSEVLFYDNRVIAKHSLHGALTLKQAIMEGKVLPVVEMRCPNLFISKVSALEFSQSDISKETNIAQHEIEYHPNNYFGITSVYLELIAIQDFDLRTDELNKFAWEKNKYVSIEKGFKLARSRVSVSGDLVRDMLEFKLDDSLPQGQITCELDEQNGIFIFLLPLELHSYYQREKGKQPRSLGYNNFLRACLVAACARFPYADFLKENSEILGREQLREQLEKAVEDPKLDRIQYWEEEELKNYDPLHTATLIAPFEVPSDALTEDADGEV